MESRWPWPPWVTLLAIALAAALVAAVYFHENRRAGSRLRAALAAMRMTVIAMALAMIAQFSLALQRTGLPSAAVLVDDSLSMTTVDRYEGQAGKMLKDRVRRTIGGDAELSRWNLAAALLTERDAALLAGIAKNYKLRTYSLTGLAAFDRDDPAGVAERLRAMQPTGQSTRLGAAVRGVLDDLRDAAPAAMVILSDGVNTDGPSLAEAAGYARHKGVPLFCIGLGSDRPVRDLRLGDLLVDDVVFVDDPIALRFKLTAAGLQGAKIPIVLRQEGRADVLARTQATVGADGQPQDVRLLFRPKEAGRFRFVIQAEPLDDSLRPENARLAGVLQVRKEKIRVLLAQAYPSYEYRFLRNMLARDETIDLHTVLQEADVEFARQDPRALPVFPVRQEDLLAYDVVILGDVDPSLLAR